MRFYFFGKSVFNIILPELIKQRNPSLYFLFRFAAYSLLQD